LALSPLFWLYLPIAAGVALAGLAHAAPTFYAGYIEPETGLLEIIHMVQGAAAAVIAATLLPRPEVRRRPWLLGWIGLAFVGSIYIAGEEASWGQHIFAWTTPGDWSAINDQAETNLHNVSSWLDQKPRLLLEIGVIVGGLVMAPLQLHGRYLQRGRLAYLTPAYVCVPTAAMALLVRFDDIVTDNTDIGILLFHRASEVQEFYFYYFVCLYLAMLSRRLRAIPPPS
jgi:hypothetical protein